MESVIIKESNTNGLTSNAGNKNNPSTQWMGLGAGGQIPAGSFVGYVTPLALSETCVAAILPAG